jgi:hypothetical protein
LIAQPIEFLGRTEMHNDLAAAAGHLLDLDFGAQHRAQLLF